MTEINIHLLIMVSLIAFGSGNALAKARFGPVMFSMVVVFFSLIYFQIRNDSWSIWAVAIFIFGIFYAHRDSSAFSFLQDIYYSISSGLRDMVTRIFSTSDSNETASDKQSDNTQSDSAWKAEHSRREAEVKAERAWKKQQTSGHSSESEQTDEEPVQRNSQSNNQEQSQQGAIEEKLNDRRSSLEILGLSSGFSQEELKRAYKRESARCHPDKWMGKPQHLRHTMEEEQRLINRAYAALKE